MTALMGLETRLKLAKLHLITDLRSKQGDLKDVVVAAMRGGVDLVQLRDANASTEELVEALELVRSAALQLQAGVVVGCDLATARKLNADYVHLGAAHGKASRDGLGEFTLIGQSVHSVDQIQAGQADDLISWMFVGPVFSEPRHPGLDLVREAAQRVPVDAQESTPWFAVGGITAKNVEQVVEAGALRVAVSSAITAASDPQAAAEKIKAVLQAAWDARPEMEKFSFDSFGGGAPIALLTEEEKPAEDVLAPAEDEKPAEQVEAVEETAPFAEPVEEEQPVEDAQPVEEVQLVEAPEDADENREQ